MAAVDGRRRRRRTPGTLDRSFSGDGIKLIDFGRRDTAEHVSVDAAGRITVAGTAGGGIPLARLLNNGRLDRSFAGDGKRVADPVPGADAPLAWAVSEGRLIVFGFSLSADRDYYLMRFHADGRTDRSFGREGVVTGRFARDPLFGYMVTLPTGRIVIMGEDVGGKTHLKAYKPDGTRARSFGDGGTAIVDGAWSSLVYHPDGRLLLGCAASVGSSSMPCDQMARATMALGIAAAPR